MLRLSGRFLGGSQREELRFQPAQLIDVLCNFGRVLGLLDPAGQIVDGVQEIDVFVRELGHVSAPHCAGIA